jgi:PqqD family protein of HPr-rel-A system
MRAAAPVRFVPSVSLRLGPERGFLFDQRTGRVYSLNETAAFTVARLAAGAGAAEVEAALVDTFDVEVDTARADLARFVEHLVEEGLVERHG